MLSTMVTESSEMHLYLHEVFPQIFSLTLVLVPRQVSEPIYTSSRCGSFGSKEW